MIEKAAAWEAKACSTTKPDENGDLGQVVWAASAIIVVLLFLLSGCAYICTGDGSASGVPTECHWGISTSAFNHG